ncbi:MAG: type IV pilin protein [Clostridium sp.]
MIKNRKNQAFTLSELLVVVAIVGILVAISIPVFASQREKARRAVDMDTARKIKSALVLAYNNEEIQVPKTTSSNGYGTWVMCFATAQQNMRLRLTATTEKR